MTVCCTVTRKQQLDDDSHSGTGGNKTEENREFRGEKYRLPTVRNQCSIHLSKSKYRQLRTEIDLLS